MVIPPVIIGKMISFVSQRLNIGTGETWPGEVALKFKDILSSFTSKLKRGVILIAGTNGKTTTSLMIKRVLEKKGFRVIHNESGANLLNGLVSSFIKKTGWRGTIKADFAVLEVDENSLPIILDSFTPKVLIMLNLFRDQLDRYGEVDVIADKWQKALNKIAGDTTIIVNADDPLIAHLGRLSRAKILYFGLEEPKSFQKNLEHATDSIFCLNCGHRLSYKGIYFSHLGLWHCQKCGSKRPKVNLSTWDSVLPGLYNRYNTLAGVAALKSLGISEKEIKQGLKDFIPAFGRQEEIEIQGKKIKIFLAKNPTGFNETLKTVISLGGKQLLIVLNDQIPDGRDVSWIWDVDFEMLPSFINPVVSGDRAYDLAVRLKYSRPAQTPIIIYENLSRALDFCIHHVNQKDPLYILATYSAMLEVRKILSGRKIL